MFGLFRAARAPVRTAPLKQLPPLNVAGRSVAVELTRNPRARRLTLCADAVRGVVRVTLPPRVSVAEASRFVAAHHGWIAARVARWPVAVAFVPGAAIPFDGGVLTLDWHPSNPRGVLRDGDRLRCGGDAATLPGRVTRWLRSQALAALAADTHRLASQIGKTVAAVAVRDPAGRWGSCAANTHIAYSWRLILAPPAVRFSVVAHEVAHLVHANHGAAFWRLAAELNGGDPAAQRRWLKEHGAALHWVGRVAGPGGAG